MQLTLGINLHDDATFASFYPGENRQVVDQLKLAARGIGEKSIYLYAVPGSGLSHLLQACCHESKQQALSAVYIPLTHKTQLSPQILDCLENLSVICLDNLECIINDRDWEEAIFHCYNRLQNTPSRLIVSASTPPQQLSCTFPDLVSRLAATVIFQVKPLSDIEKIAALQLRAKQRGFELPTEVGNYLLQHHPRDMHELYTLLDKLDKASLSAQRKLTIPFVKTVL